MQKFCPNCGEETDGNTRFCTHCGYDLQADQATVTTETSTQPTTDNQATAVPANDRVAQVQAYSKNYFKWLVDSFKKPDLEEPGERYFGIISMVLSALLLTFAIVAAFNRCIKQINASAASSVVVLKNLSFGMDFKFFMLVLIVILFYVVIGYGASALGNDQATHVNFFDYLNRFAHLTNISLILNIILIISVYTITFNVNSPLTFFKQLGFAIVVLALISMVWQAGYIIAIHKSIKTPRIDKFFMVLLALIVMAIALYIFARIEWENLALDFAQEFSQGTSAGSLFNLF